MLMGVLSFLGLRPPKIPSFDVVVQPVLDFAQGEVMGMSVERFWKEQPYLRMVVGFLSRSVASVSIHVLERADDGSRIRLRDTELARMVKEPNSAETMYELMNGTVADLALYDEALLVVLPTGRGADARWEMYRVPPSWLQSKAVSKDNPFKIDAFLIQRPGMGQPVEVKAENAVYLHGWNPANPLTGDSPVNALRKILWEQIQASVYRTQIWTNNPRLNAYISRPAGATWTNEQKERFAASFKSAYTGRGAEAGGVPVLEDGMKLEKMGFSSHEEEFVEASKLALQTVAAVYHVNPTMLGQNDGANYSNVREFRRMLYGDTLAPILKQIESKLNQVVVPLVAPGGDVYVEFNLQEKLRGSFEEQARVLQSAVGRPFMTVNEARSLQNLPNIDNGDELYIPLNMGTADDFAPTDEGVSDAV